jgi:ABC-2 type transport system ATP-binding protein
MITVEHLRKRYRGATAVDDISFTVQTGKVTGFLGPNGAGKSTTMRLMLGLDRGEGKTMFDGKPLHNYAQPSKVVGILLDAKAFHPTRLANRHLKVLAAEGGIPDSRVTEVLDLVGLSSVARKTPGKFSLGMAQRLGLAGAILGNPKYLILDEPANGLDPEGIVWLREFLKKYADQGNAVFVSSHLLSEMALMADNVVVIGRGRVIANTSISELTTENAHSSVFVRTDKASQMERLFKESSFEYTKSDGGFNVVGKPTDEIGKLAFGAGIPILELSKHVASLEDVFLELTEGSEEFTGKSKKKGHK